MWRARLEPAFFGGAAEGSNMCRFVFVVGNVFCNVEFVADRTHVTYCQRRLY